MTINQIMPLIDNLPLADKLQLMQNLLSKIAAEQNLLKTSTENVNIKKHDSIRDNPAFGMWSDMPENTSLFDDV